MEVCNKRKRALDLEINNLMEKSDPADAEELESLKEKRTRLEKIISHDGQELKDIQERVKNNG